MLNVYKIELTGDDSLDDEPVTRAEIYRHMKPFARIPKHYCRDDLCALVEEMTGEQPDLELDDNALFPQETFTVYADAGNECHYLVEK